MYVPKKFAQTEQQKIEGLIREFPLAALVVNTDSGMYADHIPMRLSQTAPDGMRLQGHVAKANPLWQRRVSGPVLVIFQGPNGYISPNWYPTKQEHGKVVPTWNYAVVHVGGDIRFIHDRGWKLSLVRQLTDRHERGQARPWAVSDAPPEFTGKMLAAIVGFEIIVNDVCAKWKVSQNQPEVNRLGVRKALAHSGNPKADELAGY